MPTIEDVRMNKREESGMGQKVEGSLAFKNRLQSNRINRIIMHARLLSIAVTLVTVRLNTCSLV